MSLCRARVARCAAWDGLRRTCAGGTRRSRLRMQAGLRADRRAVIVAGRSPTLDAQLAAAIDPQASGRAAAGCGYAKRRLPTKGMFLSRRAVGGIRDSNEVSQQESVNGAFN